MRRWTLVLVMWCGCPSEEEPTDTTTVPDPCADVTCENGGTCDAASGTAVCVCATGFTGDSCATDIDECAADNGGCDALTTCTNTVGGRECSACPPQYAGTGEEGCFDPIACADEACLAATTSKTPLTLELTPVCDGPVTVCCTGGKEVTPCGPLSLDFTEQEGDSPRYVGQSPKEGDALAVRMRARVSSAAPIPVGLQAGDCELTVDSLAGNREDVEVLFSFTRVDADTGATLDRTAIQFDGFESTDLTLGPKGACAASATTPVAGALNALALDVPPPWVCDSCPCN